MSVKIVVELASMPESTENRVIEKLRMSDTAVMVLADAIANLGGSLVFDVEYTRLNLVVLDGRGKILPFLGEGE